MVDLIYNHYPMIVSFVIGTLGACFGSFASLIIYRWPLSLSIIWPSSFCGHCQSPIRPWHNVPIFSWLYLKGRCAYCQKSFGIRPLIIELIGLLSALALYYKFGLSIALIDKAGFIFVLVLIAYIDHDTFYIPLRLIIALMLWGLIFGFIYYAAPHFYVPAKSALGPLKMLVIDNTNRALMVDRLLGALVGLLGFSLVNVAATMVLRKTKRLTQKQWAMGWGDPLLLMGIAFSVGLSHLLLVVFLASFLGSIIGISLRIFGAYSKESEDLALGAIPYGPFLAVAGIYVCLL